MERLIEVDKEVRIELYTSENLNEPQLLEINNKASVETSNYNTKFPTRIFIHGFQSNGGLTKVFVNGTVLDLLNSPFKNCKFIQTSVSIFRPKKTRCKFDSNQLGKGVQYNQLPQCQE